ncbi:MAG: helix-turn-helix transcriptional regulator [Ruminococcaceae bacterium]|nr:helix-turn-helix transcriptional regulator [Oscillospiraceae bacterium]
MTDFFADYSETIDVRRGEWWQRTGGYHQHEADELMLIEHGRSEVSCFGYTETHAAPFIVFYPHGIPHRQINDTDYAYSRYLIQFSSARMEGLISPEVIPRSFFVLPLSEAELACVKPYMALLMKELPLETQEVRRRHLIAILLSELAPMTKARWQIMDERAASDRQFVHDICSYIGEHPADSIGLEELAHRFFISRAKLVQMFKKYLGMTVGDYRASVRIARAKALLCEGVSVQETAIRLGYTNVSFFIRLFRRCVGVNPGEYQKMV